MIGLQIDTSQFIDGLRRSSNDLFAGVRQALGQSVAVALNSAKGTAAFHDRTGKLRRSIVRGQSSEWVLFLKTGTKYARFVEGGTRPHVIEGKRSPRKVLHFSWRGEPSFFRRVHHPGTKPRRFMQAARDEGERSLESMIARAMRHAFR